MTIEEFKKIHYPDGKGQSERREIFNCKNSVYMVNEIPVDILFIGSSTTERFEVYPYFHKFGNIVNRGIGGEATPALRKRIELDAINLKPKVCVVSEGLNNLADLWRYEHAGNKATEEMKEKILVEFKEDYTEIIQKLKANGIITVIGAVTPIGVVDCRNEMVLRQNEILKELCEKENVTFVDYYSVLVSDDGITMKDLTFGDDLHTHVEGFNMMAELLMPVFEEIFNK